MNRAGSGPAPRVTAGRVLVEALRFDMESPDEVRRRVEFALSLDIGGFLLFGAVADVAARLIEDIRSAAGRPLWLAADLERGAGQHLRGLTTFPPPAALARHPTPLHAVRLAARRTAREARAAGLNLALAPILDLDVEPTNPIVGTRSFGPDPDMVAELGRAWIEACQDEGVAACAKHFPGHGRATADSHAELPVVEQARDALEADLTPFRAVARQVACVMTAHVAFPGLGAAGPATLDAGILQDLLRRDLGFAGLVLTDALNMQGARVPGAGERMSPEAAALAAGCDLLLYPPRLEAAVHAVQDAAEASPRVAERLEEAIRRSAEVLAEFESRAAAGRAASEAAPALAGPDVESAAIARECVASIGGGPPAWLRPPATVGVTTVWDDRVEPKRPPFGERFREALASAGWRVSEPGPGGLDAPLVVLVAATPQAWKGTAGLTPSGRAAVEGALATGRAYPVVFGHPRLLEALGRPGLCAWSTEPAMEEAAAARLAELVGRAMGPA